MPEFIPGPDTLRPIPSEAPIFVSQAEKDINLNVAREEVLRIRGDLNRAQSTEEQRLLEEGLVRAEAHYERLARGVVLPQQKRSKKP